MLVNLDSLFDGPDWSEDLEDQIHEFEYEGAIYTAVYDIRVSDDVIDVLAWEIYLEGAEVEDIDQQTAGRENIETHLESIYNRKIIM